MNALTPLHKVVDTATSGHGSASLSVSRAFEGVAQKDIRPERAMATAPTGLQGGDALECVSNSLSWFVGKHRPYEGHIAVERAQEAGFKAVSPRQVVRRPGRDETISPVFPGYVFVSFDVDRSDWGVLTNPPPGRQPALVSVLKYVSGAPARLPMGFVEAFMRGANADGVFPWWWPGEPPSSPATRVGKQHQVMSGPWASFVGKCTSANRNKVNLLLDLFGRATVVEFRAEQLREVQ